MRWTQVLPALSLLAPLPAWSQSRTQLTLDDAIAVALKQNPVTQQAEYQLEEAEARLKQARASYFPQVTTSGLAKIGLSGALNGLNPVGLANSPFYRNVAEAANVYHPGFDFGRSSHFVGQQRYRRDVHQANLEAAKAAVRLETTQGFYSVLQSLHLKDVTQQVLRSHEINLRQAQAFYEGKLRSRVDVELARFSLSEAQLQVLQAENTLQGAFAKLGMAMGASQETRYDLVEPDQPLPETGSLTDWIQLAKAGRPELTALRAEREAASEAVRLAESQRKPMLSFFFSGGYARFTNVVVRQLLALGTGLSFPLYTGGRLEGQVEEAQARLRSIASELARVEQQVELQTRSAFWRLQNALQSLEALRAQSVSAREAARLARARYRERLAGIVELSQAEANLAEAEVGVIIGTYSIRVAYAELQHASGQ